MPQTLELCRFADADLAAMMRGMILKDIGGRCTLLRRSVTDTDLGMRVKTCMRAHLLFTHVELKGSNCKIGNACQDMG